MSLHLFIIHFPIALVVIGAAFDLVGFGSGNAEIRKVAGWLLVLGAFFVLVAFITGEGAISAAAGRIGPGDPRIDTHGVWGAIGTWALVLGAGLRAAWRRRLVGIRSWIALAVALLSAGLVMMIAYTGTAIMHGG